MKKQSSTSMIEEVDARLNWLPLVQRQQLALIRLAIGGSIDNCLALCKVDWEKLYAEAEKQSVVGICWAGIERLPKDRLPDMDWLMEWLGQAEYIKSQNGEVNGAVAEVVSLFQQAGMQGVVLKGQGLAQLYPQPELRTPGDIDYLIKDADIDKVVALARKNNPGYLHVTYHHCDFGKISGVEVEAHWRASWFYTPWYNKRFQEFCKEYIEDKKGFAEKGFYDKNQKNPSVEDEPIGFGANACKSEIVSELPSSDSQPSSPVGCTNSSSTEAINHACGKNLSFIPTPSLAFNRVYVLVHIYRHLFFEGIGLRQIVDYYMVLQASAKDSMWAQQKIETMQRLKELGMARFTAAVMWVLQHVFEPSEAIEPLEQAKPLNQQSWMLCPVNEKDGKFLLQEIMRSGNFGKSDERMKFGGKSFAEQVVARLRRNLYLFRFGASEVLWTLPWRTWHYFWMKKYNRK